jgi:chromosome segregation ATPase
MSEHESAPLDEDTPQNPTAPQEETAAEDHNVVDYRSRYENLLPEFTRKSQRLAELEAAQAEYGEQPQYEDDGEYEEEYEYESLSPADIQRLVRQQADVQAEIAFVNSEIDTLERELSEEFSDAEWDYLGRTSEQLRDEAGRPDVRRAYEQLNGILEDRKQKWVSGKPTRSAKPASGPGAAEVVDLDDSEARAEFIDRVMGNIDPE